MGSHPLLGRVPAHAEWYHAETGKVGEPLGDASERVLEPEAVVHAGAHHHLTVDLDAVVEEHPQPPQARAAPTVAQHLGALARIGGVDAHVERTESLGYDPLEVGLSEARQRREVAVEERQAVVVVLEVEAAAHPRRQLVDEAELAVVIAGLDPVEQRAVDLDAQRRTVGLVDLDLMTQSTTVDLEQQRRLVNQ